MTSLQPVVLMLTKQKNMGRIFWVTGPPGAGKSTTCQLMAKHHGYIYLELDGLELWFNPFPDLNAGWLAAQKSKALKVSLIGGKLNVF